MGFLEAIKSGFQNYANFSGRAPRSAYWWWTLFSLLIAIIASVVDLVLFPDLTMAMGGIGPIYIGVLIVLFLPGLSVSVRRLHDIGRSGWWLLIFLIPFVGFIVLIIWFASKGEEGANKYGPNPLAA